MDSIESASFIANRAILFTGHGHADFILDHPLQTDEGAKSFNRNAKE